MAKFVLRGYCLLFETKVGLPVCIYNFYCIPAKPGLSYNDLSYALRFHFVTET